jgi:hypothetical protein
MSPIGALQMEIPVGIPPPYQSEVHSAAIRTIWEILPAREFKVNNARIPDRQRQSILIADQNLDFRRRLAH